MTVKAAKGLNKRLDDTVSLLVREAADWTCQFRIADNCVVSLPDRRGAELQCCHYVGRARHATRWHTDNLACGCWACHYQIDVYPALKQRAFRALIGEVLMEELTNLGMKPRKWYTSEKREMLEHYRGEHKRVLEARNRGETGVIQVVPYQ